ncbi:MAG TPA: hypothetical protein VE871_15215 [Longimicrobium sp.]|nr:hypothetical protein [Longimicrobium sp.]
MKNPFRFPQWVPFERRALMDRVKAHLESLDTLGFDVGEGDAVLDFLAGLRDMDAVQTLLMDCGLSRSEGETLLGWVEERRDEMSRPRRKWRFW